MEEAAAEAIRDLQQMNGKLGSEGNGLRKNTALKIIISERDQLKTEVATLTSLLMES